MVFCSTMELRPESLIPSSHAVVFSGATLLFQKIKEEKKKFGFLKKSCACFKHSNLFKVKGLGTPESAPPPLSQTPQQTSFSTPILHTQNSPSLHPSLKWDKDGRMERERWGNTGGRRRRSGRGGGGRFLFGSDESRVTRVWSEKRKRRGKKKREWEKKKEDFFLPLIFFYSPPFFFFCDRKRGLGD